MCDSLLLVINGAGFCLTAGRARAEMENTLGERDVRMIVLLARVGPSLCSMVQSLFCFSLITSSSSIWKKVYFPSSFRFSVALVMSCAIQEEMTP